MSSLFGWFQFLLFEEVFIAPHRLQALCMITIKMGKKIYSNET